MHWWRCLHKLARCLSFLCLFLIERASLSFPWVLNFTPKLNTKSKVCKSLIRPCELLSVLPHVWRNSLFFSHKLKVFQVSAEPQWLSWTLLAPHGEDISLLSVHSFGLQQLAVVPSTWMLQYGWEHARDLKKSPEPISSCLAQINKYHLIEV